MNDIICVPEYNEGKVLFVKEILNRHLDRIHVINFGHYLLMWKSLNYYFHYHKSYDLWTDFFHIFNRLEDWKLICKKFITEDTEIIDKQTVIFKMKEEYVKSTSGTRKKFLLKMISKAILEFDEIFYVKYAIVREPIISYCEQKELLSNDDLVRLKELFESSPNAETSLNEYCRQKSKYLLETITPEYIDIIREQNEKKIAERLRKLEK